MEFLGILHDAKMIVVLIVFACGVLLALGRMSLVLFYLIFGAKKDDIPVKEIKEYNVVDGKMIVVEKKKNELFLYVLRVFPTIIIILTILYFAIR